jgi:hypothetical protein
MVMPALLIIPAVILVILLGLLAIAPNKAINQEFNPTPPYPQSELIKEISFDFSSEFSAGEDSDQWPMTWADDGNIYAAWGDGEGWERQFGAKQYLGVSRLTGEPSALSAVDSFGSNDVNRKPLGIIADANGHMYLFFDTRNDNWKGSYGAKSTDNGQSWSFGFDPVFHRDIDRVRVVGIAQFGPGYTRIPPGVDDNYFYVYLSDRTDGREATGKDVYLGRVPREQIFVRGAYQYYGGTDTTGNPAWSPVWENKRAVFHDDAGMAYHVSVSYNPGLGRFIYAKGHNTSHLGIFEAPNLWGPWRTVYYGPFRDPLWKFTYQFPQKWMSANGRTLWMGFSGWPGPEHDKVYFIKASLTLDDSRSNHPPTVDAGLDRSINLLESVILDGAVSDDGLPNPPGKVNTSWTQLSGPGTVVFGDPLSQKTIASFSVGGIYVLQLNADDGELSASKEVLVSVNTTTSSNKE